MPCIMDLACDEGMTVGNERISAKMSTHSNNMSTKTVQRKPITLTLKEKLEVIKCSEGGKSSRELARMFGVGKTQIGNILKRKTEFIELERNNASPDQKRCVRATGNEDINDLTYAWFCDAIHHKIEVKGSMLQEKALQFAVEMNKTSFKASNGWKESFIKRYNIAFGKLNIESGEHDVPEKFDSDVNDWREQVPFIIEGYSERDIYVMDETGLYYKTTQNKNFYKKREMLECSAIKSKELKERVTISLCANMAGEKEPILFVGKVKKPGAFKFIDCDKLPVTYRYSKKALMSTVVFSSWLHSFNQRMASQGRNVLLFLDNARSHVNKHLSNVTLCFLPANITMTSVLQPLEQGVIQSLKMKYRKKQFQHIMLEMKKENFRKTGLEIMGKVNILHAILWIAEAWKQVNPAIITECFRRSGFNTQVIMTRLLSVNNPKNLMLTLLFS